MKIQISGVMRGLLFKILHYHRSDCSFLATFTSCRHQVAVPGIVPSKAPLHPVGFKQGKGAGCRPSSNDLSLIEEGWKGLALRGY